MPSPFPGIDPYLECQGRWPDLRASFVTYACDALNDRLPEHYIAQINEQIRLAEAAEGGFSEEIRDIWVEILHLPNLDLVTAIEMLSPSNKAEPGFGQYRFKRGDVLAQFVNLVELDFLLGGHRIAPRRPLPTADYYALVARADRRPDCEVYAWTVRQPPPTIKIPLRAPDPDVPLDLADLFAVAYDRGRYARLVDYARPLTVPLAPDDRAWAESLARAAAR